MLDSERARRHLDRRDHKGRQQPRAEPLHQRRGCRGIPLATARRLFGRARRDRTQVVPSDRHSDPSVMAREQLAAEDDDTSDGRPDLRTARNQAPAVKCKERRCLYRLLSVPEAEQTARRRRKKWRAGVFSASHSVQVDDHLAEAGVWGVLDRRGRLSDADRVGADLVQHGCRCSCALQTARAATWIAITCQLVHCSRRNPNSTDQYHGTCAAASGGLLCCSMDVCALSHPIGDTGTLARRIHRAAGRAPRAQPEAHSKPCLIEF